MNEITRQLRKDALYLSHKCEDGNLQSVFSCMDILWALYDGCMNYSRDNASSEDRDYCIISKGQATLALYPILIKKGIFEMKEVADEIGNFRSRYCIQTDITKFPEGGIENNAGSLGHGFPFAVGIANGSKIQGWQNKVYALCGDGEMCEGTMWEACLFATNRKLDNLCMIIDDNSSVGTMVDMGALSEKLISFGFDVVEVDGHNEEQIKDAINSIMNKINGRPKAVIAKTIRGFGSETMMNNDIWFHKAPNEEELQRLVQEVDLFEKSIS